MVVKVRTYPETPVQTMPDPSPPPFYEALNQLSDETEASGIRKVSRTGSLIGLIKKMTRTTSTVDLGDGVKALFSLLDDRKRGNIDRLDVTTGFTRLASVKDSSSMTSEGVLMISLLQAFGTKPFLTFDEFQQAMSKPNLTKALKRCLQQPAFYQSLFADSLGMPSAATGIHDIQNIRSAHYTEPSSITGATVLLFEEKVKAVVLKTHGCLSLDVLHGIVLISGSSNGSEDLCHGVREIASRLHRDVPVVVEQLLINTGGMHKRLPSPESIRLCADAAASSPLREGVVGAGAGASVGELSGQVEHGGFGSTVADALDGIPVAGLVIVNTVASVRDPETGVLLAGRDSMAADFFAAPTPLSSACVVVVDADLTPSECESVARMVRAAWARCFTPAFLPNEDNTIYVVATGRHSLSPNQTHRWLELVTLGITAVSVVEKSIVRAVRESR